MHIKKSLLYYLTYQFVPKPFTLKSNSKNTIIQKYNFGYIDKAKDLNFNKRKICKELYSKLKSNIQALLPPGTRPIGLLLSGGIDSSAILHILREITKRKIYTITGAFHKGADNLIRAHKLAYKYRTIHTDLIIHPNAIHVLDEIYSNNIPQPIGDSGLPLTYLMMKRLKKHVELIFSGDGADCLFCGLDMHYLNLLVNKKNKLKPNGFEHYRFGEIFLTQNEFNSLFDIDFPYNELIRPLNTAKKRIRTKDILKRQILIDLNFLVKNRIDYLLYSSKICKAKICLPYLMKDFVDFAIRIPSRYLINGTKQKFILKETFKDILPEEVITGKKEGFHPVFKLWYERNKEFVIRNILESFQIGIPKKYINYLISMFPQSHRYNTGMKIWLILNLACWHRNTVS